MQIRCLYDKLVPISELKPHPKNRNAHPQDQIERLAKILKYQGWRYPIKVSKQSGFITSGHGRLAAAILNRWDSVPVNYQDYENTDQEYADLIADNSVASWAELELAKINLDLADLGPDFDLDMLGIKDFELEPADKNPGCDEDEVPEKVEPRTKLGDIYTLGNHRLMCGDSTSIDVVEKLMDGHKANMVFTDPPYNQSKSSGGFNDNRQGWAEHKADNLNDFEPENIFPTYGALGAQSGYFFSNKGLLPKYLSWAETMGGWDLLVMGKENPIPTKHKKYLSDLEYIVFIRSSGAYFNDSLEYDFYRKVRMVSVKAREFGHPTEKQVRVIEPFLQVSSPSGGMVVDIFGGSGSTLIACEKTNRKCLMMELDPHYCDVIVARWEKYTGQKAELLSV